VGDVDAVAEVRSFEQFFRAEYRSLVALGAWLTGDRAAGEDLAQEALRTAHRRWDAVGGYERPGTFVRRVVINLASNERRRRGREQRAVGRLTLLAEPSAPAPSAAEPDPLWAEVAALPMQQRAAIGLRYLEDRTTAEIAEALECSEATVRVHLHRAHRRLAERLGCTTDSVEPDEEGST
jgi:RNA polymerase sigma factor (sigma-70 family)